MEVLKVSAVIVTRGDVALGEILESLPPAWEIVVWQNDPPTVRIYSERGQRGIIEFWENAWKGPSGAKITDLAVYGRYAAIEYASGDLIYVQDDDVIVSDPQALVREWERTAMFRRSPNWDLGPGNPDPHGFLVANMPAEFRHDFYEEHCLVGFGAVFHREAPARAFDRFVAGFVGTYFWDVEEPEDHTVVRNTGFFRRTCDVAFTALTPRVLVDVPKRNLPWATAPNRMYMTGGQHVSERMRMLELAKQVRDA